MPMQVQQNSFSGNLCNLGALGTGASQQALQQLPSSVGQQSGFPSFPPTPGMLPSQQQPTIVNMIYALASAVAQIAGILGNLFMGSASQAQPQNSAMFGSATGATPPIAKPIVSDSSVGNISAPKPPASNSGSNILSSIMSLFKGDSTTGSSGGFGEAIAGLWDKVKGGLSTAASWIGSFF